MSTPRAIAVGELPILGRTTAAVPDVLALHGWARTAGDFDWLLADPPPGLGVAAVDLPGFGQSPPPPAAWGTPQYAEALAAGLDAKGWRDLIVLGHSFGGRVAVRLAARRPDLVRGLVLSGVPLLRRPDAPTPGSAPAYRLVRALRRARLVPQSLLERARQRYGSADYRAAGPVLRPILVATVNEDYGDDLAAIGVPVALVWGADDTMAWAGQVERLADVLQVSHRVIAGGKGHDTVREMRPQLRDAVAALAAETRPDADGTRSAEGPAS